MGTKHYSLRTEEAYAGWIKRFILFHGKRHPNEMAEAEIAAFLSYLANERGVAAATQNQALSALLFLYKEVLQKQEIGFVSGFERPSRLPRVPVVFTMPEVRLVLSLVRSDYRVMAELLYGSGLRLMECVRLRVKDVDFGYHQITVRDGKGAKDRVTMLPERLKEPLRLHLEKVRALHREDLARGFGSVYRRGATGSFDCAPGGTGRSAQDDSCFMELLPRRDARSILVPGQCADITLTKRICRMPSKKRWGRRA